MLRRAWVLGLLTAGALLPAGCCCHLTSQPPVSDDIREACTAVAYDSRCHVYLFFLREPDPFDCAGLNGLKETMEALGFPRAWCGLGWHVKAFQKEIARICHDDPQAHFVLVGHCRGVDAAAELARRAGEQGVQFELLLGLGKRVECPACVCRQLTLVPCGKGCDDQDVHEVHAKRLLDLPSHPETVEILTRELFALAGSIPSVIDLPKMYYPDKEPTPRPVMPPSEVRRNDWDFLKPALVDDRETLPPGTLPLPAKKGPAATAARLGRW